METRERWGVRQQKLVFNFLFSFYSCCLWLSLHIFSTLQSWHLVSFGFRLDLLQESTIPSQPPLLTQTHTLSVYSSLIWLAHLTHSSIHTSDLNCVFLLNGWQLAFVLKAYLSIPVSPILSALPSFPPFFSTLLPLSLAGESHSRAC